jgi:hypothetical protein
MTDVENTLEEARKSAEYLSGQTEECMVLVIKQREQLCAFYDARVVFACYSACVSRLGAALRHTKIYTPEMLMRLFSETMIDALTAESETKLEHLDKRTMEKGSKQ